MASWTIRCYLSGSGRDLFDADLRDQTVQAQAEFRSVLNGLRDEPGIEGWNRPNGFDRLSGKFRELGKLRFKANGVQHRPLGFFGPHNRTFTLLIWATERDGEWDPPNVRETALQRMKLVKNKPEEASHECDF